MGFKKSRFNYVFFLDADDLWLPDKISVQISEMQRRGLAFSFGGWCHFDSTTTGSMRGFSNGNPNIDSFLKKEFAIGCLTVCIDKNLIYSVAGNFSSSKERLQNVV